MIAAPPDVGYISFECAKCIEGICTKLKEISKKIRVELEKWRLALPPNTTRRD